MNFYYGIRSTGNNLHIGHIISLFKMFNDIIKINNIDNIFFLLAEIHSEISNIPIKTINNNSYLLANKIFSLFYTFLLTKKINNISFYLEKIKFIFQNDENIYHYHLNITYKFFPLISSAKVLKNPIFKKSENKSVAFLLYPILQAFDVLLYNNEQIDMIVYLSNDQKSNINIMKDIFSKLNINNIKFKINENVITDVSGKEKMSKSLNNIINFDNFEDIKNYIIKYVTDVNNNCLLYNNLLQYFIEYLNFKNIKYCKENKCFNCKKYYIDNLKIFIDLYNYTSNLKIDITKNIFGEKYLKENYNNLLNKIECNRGII